MEEKVYLVEQAISQSLTHLIILDRFISLLVGRIKYFFQLVKVRKNEEYSILPLNLGSLSPRYQSFLIAKFQQRMLMSDNLDSKGM